MALAYLLLPSPPLPEIDAKRPQARKFESRVNVAFKDVKREIVEAAKTPNRDKEKESHAQGKVFSEQNRRGDDARKQEQEALENDETRGLKVAHEEKVDSDSSRRNSPKSAFADCVQLAKAGFGKLR